MTADNLTDLGNARRLVAAHGHRFRFVPAWGAWLAWDGRRWQRDTKGEIVEAAKTIPASMYVDGAQLTDAKARAEVVKWALASESATRLEAMVKLARTEPTVAVDPDELDADIWVLNTPTGTLDLRSGELRSHTPDDLITKLTAAPYDPDAVAVRWAGFLERVLPDDEVRDFVARWAGYCLTGDVSEHKILFAFGAGANGKTTLLNTLARVLGDYARQAAPDLLMRRRDDPHPTGLADLHGARLVLATETAQGRHLDEALVKRLTGGDRIKARLMHKDFYEFAPSHKLVVATNHRPSVEGTDTGLWRRLRLVPFDVTIPDDEQDRHLDDKLAAEGAGILGWAVNGCLRWRNTGLTEPTAVLAATADYRAEMDVVGEWISECCLLVPELNARASDLHNAYGRWAEATGERTISQRRLGIALRERGLDKYTNNGVWWRGIGLLATERSEPSERSYSK